MFRSSGEPNLGSDSGIPLNYEAMLSALVSHGVVFVVIGGIGAVLLGAPILSVDVDVIPEGSEDNLTRLAGALIALRAEVIGAGRVLNLGQGEWLRASRFWNFDTDLGRLDVVFAPAGAEDFPLLQGRATNVVLEDATALLVASVDDLIAMKEAAGRAKDLYVLPTLRWLRDRDQPPP